jgi:hypothetical protein
VNAVWVADERTQDPRYLRADQAEDDHPDAEDGPHVAIEDVVTGIVERSG